MIKNYIKITFRNLVKHKSYTFINIAGLATGMACCIVIFMSVRHELSFDNYHKDSDRIYRIPTIVKSGVVEKSFARGLTPLIPVLRKDFPEIEASTRFHYWSTSNVKIQYNNETFIENSLMVTESDFFDVFTIPFLFGNPNNALDMPGSIVITEEIANKIFASENPIGQTLKVNGSDFKITGVIENAPENTHLRYDIILSLKTVENRMNMENWGWTGFYSYVKLLPNTDPQTFEKKIRKIAHNYIGEELDKLGIEIIIFLQPLESIHLHSKLHREIKKPGNLLFVYIFCVVGILVLLVACINFMNLATTRSGLRAKEIGIRKVMGASVTNVVTLLSKDFVKLVLLANFIAFPVAWYAMNKWLQNFAYRIEIGWWVFALAGGLALSIAILTVSTQAIRAALANPVESLRYE